MTQVSFRIDQVDDINTDVERPEFQSGFVLGDGGPTSEEVTQMQVKLSKQPRVSDQQLVIGLVNNISDGAPQTTEDQFRELLNAASPDLKTRLRCFSLPELQRSPQGQAYVKQFYEPINALCSGPLDGLIVTGTEPRALLLQDERYWPAFKQLVNLADSHAIPTIWSCLAAHGALLYLDGIHRRPLREKLSGIFECKKIIEHKIVAGTPPCWHVPHSRENEVAEEDLLLNGYQILSASGEVGADVFVREGRSLFVFMQGHPEYGPDALFREYRRDVRRFLAGERDHYPAIPRGYFDADATATLVAFEDLAAKRHSIEAGLRFPEHSWKFAASSWRDLALCLYGNWLAHIAHQSTQQPQVHPSHSSVAVSTGRSVRF
jgi:homoserine O-succinyltransferase/O-acetyltransferase